MGTADEVDRAAGNYKTCDGPAGERERNGVYGGVERENGARRAGRFVVSAMQVDAAPLGVRYGTRFIARECERCARNPDLPSNGKDRCEQAQALQEAAGNRASRFHLSSKVPCQGRKGSAPSPRPLDE